jgi:hypothetical protein
MSVSIYTLKFYVFNLSKIFCFDIKIFVKIPNRDYHKVCKSVVIVSSDRTVPIKLLNPGGK